MIAVIVGVVIFAGGDDDKSATTTSAASTSTAASTAVSTTAGGGASTTAAAGAATTAATTATTAAPSNDRNAITFNEAKAQGRTDLTFMDSCDTTTGRLKIPDAYAQECFANVADNGGATAPGVTGDEITVVVYIAPDSDPILDFITAAIDNDDTGAQTKQTYQDYTDMMNTLTRRTGARSWSSSSTRRARPTTARRRAPTR